MANTIYPFICSQKKTKRTVNISGFIHTIILKLRVDENPMTIEFAILGKNAKHINAKSQREENTKGRRPINVLSAIKIKNAAIKRKMSGIATLSRANEFMLLYFANVRDHRWLPVARSMPGEERAQAWSVTRVAIRWIALFDCLF